MGERLALVVRTRIGETIMQAYKITEKHGREMYALGLKHALELAKIYADSGRTLTELVELLQEKLDEETENGNA